MRYGNKVRSASQVSGWLPSGVTSVVATGGTETTITVSGQSYKVHTFSSSGDFVVTSPGYVEYLIVGGGGGSRSDRGGGGGAGGYRCSVPGETSGRGSTAEPLFYVESGTYSVVIGAGGAAGTTNPQLSDRSGNDSSFGHMVAVGGGYNIATSQIGTAGGGGGGGSGDTRIGGRGVTRQGFDGGTGRRMTSIFDAAGGGGGANAAGANGGNIAASGGGNGGNGIESSIDGTPTYRGGGGGGGVDYRNTSTTGPGSGGLGGGGNGSTDAAGASGDAGTANTGGGGGGGSLRADATATNGGAGGSGVVIVRYKVY